jgi:2-oxoglutarate ferredoxin oxidoreductase subunit gamma
MGKHCELRLSGSGGQGLILAGIILAEAAINQGLNAIQTQSYGPEARGGASKAEVIISDTEIDFPKVQMPDLFLALTQDAANKYIKGISPTGIVVVDEEIDLPENLVAGKIYKLPIIRTAAEKLGKPIVANIVALGVLTELLDVLSRESVEEAVLSRVPKGTIELNRTAIMEGYALVAQTK